MKASKMVEAAKQDWIDSGYDSCFGGEITHDKIMTEDMYDALQELGNATLVNLSFNDVMAFREAYNTALNNRIKQYADDCEFEFEVARHGL